MKIAFVQLQPEFGEIDNNIDKAIDMMKSKSADLYVLPELFNTGYVFTSGDELDELSEPAYTGRTSLAISDFARANKCAVVFGFAEKAFDGIYNSCVFVNDSGNFKLYRKLHLFMNEKKYFMPGNLPLEVFSFRGATLGMMICFDWIFPEVTRCLALMGADIICHPANLVMDYCQESMKARSIENHVFTITSNRIGEEKRNNTSFVFTGKSQITDCFGAVIYRASDDKEEIYIADINVEEARNKEINDFNDLWNDRRTEYYFRLGGK